LQFASLFPFRNFSCGRVQSKSRFLTLLRFRTNTDLIGNKNNRRNVSLYRDYANLYRDLLSSGRKACSHESEARGRNAFCCVHFHITLTRSTIIISHDIKVLSERLVDGSRKITLHTMVDGMPDFTCKRRAFGRLALRIALIIYYLYFTRRCFCLRAAIFKTAALSGRQ
jgi:hypothetical protein